MPYKIEIGTTVYVKNWSGSEPSIREIVGINYFKTNNGVIVELTLKKLNSEDDDTRTIKLSQEALEKTKEDGILANEWSYLDKKVFYQDCLDKLKNELKKTTERLNSQIEYYEERLKGE